MPKDFFEWTAEQAIALVKKVRKNAPLPKVLTAPRKRKAVLEVCVVRYGTCVTHGNSASTCVTDRA